MRKSIISYGSIVDALVAVSKRLSSYEERHHMSSEDFYYKFEKGAEKDTPIVYVTVTELKPVRSRIEKLKVEMAA